MSVKYGFAIGCFAVVIPHKVPYDHDGDFRPEAISAGWILSSVNALNGSLRVQAAHARSILNQTLLFTK